MSSKIAGWVKDVNQLSDIAKEDPHVAYAGFTKGLAHRWSYIQRTIPGISDLFIPLEEAIRNNFVPAIVGRQVSELEREMLALPLRFGGLGIQNPVCVADREFEASKSITEDLKNLIYGQETDLTQLDMKNIKQRKEALRTRKALDFKNEFNRIKGQLPSECKKKAFEQASLKGVSSWLSVLPLKSLGYSLNKQDFRNSVCLRYDWNIPGIHRVDTVPVV